MNQDGQSTSDNTKRRPKPPGLRPPWPKGHSGNPGGRPKVTLSEKNARAAVEEALWQFAQMTKEELQEIMKGNPTGAQVLAAHAILGDKHVPEALNRILGKVRDSLDLTSGGKPIKQAPGITINCAEIPDEKMKLLIKATDPVPAAKAQVAPAAAEAPAEPPPPTEKDKGGT